MQHMTIVLEASDEWSYISMDATIKLCLKLHGQESYRAPREARRRCRLEMASLGGVS